MTYVLVTVASMILGVLAVLWVVRGGLPRADELRVAWPQSPTPPVVRIGTPAMFGQIPLHFSGPDRYCPECGRLLVKVHESGSFDLSAQAGIQASAEMEFKNGVPTASMIDALVIEAVCLLCHPEEAPE